MGIFLGIQSTYSKGQNIAADILSFEKKTNNLASELFATQLPKRKQFKVWKKLHKFMKMQISKKLNVYVSSMLKPIIKEQHKVLKSLPLLPVGVD